MKNRLLVSLTFALLAGCASTPTAPRAADSEMSWISPRQAVFMAADAAPDGVDGTFALHVQATGTQGGRTYLNSELDYRDQRNLTVAITPEAARQLTQRLGEHPRVALKGKDILVRGAAVRTRIAFFANGRVTDKYYFQTHVNVTDADQITLR